MFTAARRAGVPVAVVLAGGYAERTADTVSIHCAHRHGGGGRAARGGRLSVRVGVDLGGTKIEATAVDAEGREHGRRRVATPRDDYEGTLAAIAGLVTDIERDLGEQAAVGVGMPGTIGPSRASSRTRTRSG